MPDSPRVSPVTLIAGTVIVLGLIILFVFSPLPWIVSSSLSGFLHQPDPDAVCICPPVEEHTVAAVWDAIVAKTGIDPGSAVFDELQAHVAPDETLRDLTLSFYAEKDRELRSYTAYLRYDPESCGTLRVRSFAISPPGPDVPVSRPVREILAELPSVRPSLLGIRNESVMVTAGLSRETNVTYFSQPCTNLFLLENGTLAPLERIVLHDTGADVRRWNIFPQRCITVPGHGVECLSDGSIFVFAGDRVQSADLLLNTSEGREITLRECPHGPTQGQSCESTFWGGTRCENWTVE
ncbi:MAG: hypothetical protein ABFC24_08405 [Methanoregulaceae archaeon]